MQAELAKITAQKQALQAQADEQANVLSQVQESLAALRMTIAEKHAEKTAAEQTISQMQALREAMQGDRAQKQALIDSFRVPDRNNRAGHCRAVRADRNASEGCRREGADAEDRG